MTRTAGKVRKYRRVINKEVKNKIINSLIRYNPDKIGIFGSYARGETHKNSDLDILISFKKRISLLKFVQIQQELSEELGIQVDLITESSLKNPRLKSFIYRDLITIFNAISFGTIEHRTRYM